MLAVPVFTTASQVKSVLTAAQGAPAEVVQVAGNLAALIQQSPFPQKYPGTPITRATEDPFYSEYRQFCALQQRAWWGGASLTPA